jgi:hypothetical protein
MLEYYLHYHVVFYTWGCVRLTHQLGRDSNTVAVARFPRQFAGSWLKVPVYMNTGIHGCVNLASQAETAGRTAVSQIVETMYVLTLIILPVSDGPLVLVAVQRNGRNGTNGKNGLHPLLWRSQRCIASRAPYYVGRQLFIFSVFI